MILISQPYIQQTSSGKKGFYFQQHTLKRKNGKKH